MTTSDVIHVQFKPPTKAESIEDIPGMTYMLTRHWWPQVYRGSKEALYIADTLCGVLAMAGALHMSAVYSDVYMLIDVAMELHEQHSIEGK